MSFLNLHEVAATSRSDTRFLKVSRASTRLRVYRLIIEGHFFS
jgi:hypothetical protein